MHKIELRPYGPGVDADFVHTDRVTLAFWLVEEGTPVPPHSHENEQIVNVLEGELEFTIDGVTEVLGPGCVAVVPSGAEHSGRALSDCRIIDTFQPRQTQFALPAHSGQRKGSA